MSDFQNSESPQVKLVLEWLQAYKEGNFDLIAKALHKDHRRMTYPRSLNKPDRNREESLEHIAQVLTCLKDFDTIIHSVVEAPGKVVLHITSQWKSPGATEVTTRESMCIVHIVADEDGSLKIKEFEEFTDSKAYLDRT